MNRDLLENWLQEFPNCDMRQIKPSAINFDYRARGKCFACPHYGTKGTCPPNADTVDWTRFIQAYHDGILVVKLFQYRTKEEYGVSREESAGTLLKMLLKMEHDLFSNGYYWAHSFTGGSCRGCAQKFCGDGCVQPGIGRVPMEGAGIDVITTCRKAGIPLPAFPHPKEGGGVFARVGLVLVE